MSDVTPIKSVRLIKMAEDTAVLINEGDPRHEYQMTIPRGDPEGHGSLGWRLVYHGAPSRQDIHAAVSVMESYQYLLSGDISAAEAINRLRCLRRAYQSQHEETPNDR